MTFEAWLDKNFGKGADQLSKDTKFFQESTLRALWEIKNLLEAQNPTSEEKDTLDLYHSVRLIAGGIYILRLTRASYLYFYRQGDETTFYPIKIFKEDDPTFQKSLINLMAGESCYLPEGTWYLYNAGILNNFYFVISKKPFRIERPFTFTDQNALYCNTVVTVLPSLPAGTNTIGNIYFKDTLINGTIDAAAETLQISTGGLSSCGIQITGTWVGTLEFEGTVDGTNWVQVRAVQFGGTLVGGTTVNGLFFSQIGGLLYFRLRASAWTSGAASIYLEATASSNAVTLANALPTGTNIIGAAKIDKINYTPVSKYLQATASGDTTVWTPATGTKFRLLCLIFSNYGTADKTIYFKDGGTQFTPSFKISAGQVAGVPLVNCGYFSGTNNNVLAVNLSATGSIGVWALGYEE